MFVCVSVDIPNVKCVLFRSLEIIVWQLAQLSIDGHGQYICAFLLRCCFYAVVCHSLIYITKTQLNTIACKKISFFRLIFFSSLTLHFNFFMDYLIDFYHNLCISCSASDRLVTVTVHISLTNISICINIYIYDARNALNDHKNTLSWQYTALFIIKKRFCFDSLCDNFSMTFNYIAKIEFENEKLTVQMTTTTTTTERKKPKCNWFGCSFKARQTFKKKNINNGPLTITKHHGNMQIFDWMVHQCWQRVWVMENQLYQLALLLTRSFLKMLAISCKSNNICQTHKWNCIIYDLFIDSKR